MLDGEIEEAVERLIYAKRKQEVGAEQAAAEMIEYFQAFPIRPAAPMTDRELLAKELAHFEDRRAELKREIAEEEVYHANHPEDYAMPLAEVSFYELWQRQLSICTDVIKFYRQQIRRLHGRP